MASVSVLPFLGSCGGGTTAVTYLLNLVASPTTFNVGAATVVTATVTSSGVAQPGVTVTWGVTPAGAVTFSSATSVTNALGVATVNATGVTAGAATIQAAATGATTQNVAVTITTAGGPAVAVALSPTSVAVGAATTATATVTDNGAAQAGETVTFAITDAGIASFTTVNTAVTNASGQASVAITGAAVGSTTVTATALATTSSGQVLTVTAPPTQEQVVLYNVTDVQFQASNNVTGGSTPANLDLGGTRVIIGSAAGGAYLLLSNATYTQAWVRNMVTETDANFTPASLGFAGWMNRATIDPPGGKVYWARTTAGPGRELVSANLDGSGEQVLVASIPNPNGPLQVAVSPDG